MLGSRKPIIDQILNADGLIWHKRRHTVARIYEGLLAETVYDGGYGVAKPSTTSAT